MMMPTGLQMNQIWKMRMTRTRTVSYLQLSNARSLNESLQPKTGTRTTIPTRKMIALTGKTRKTAATNSTSTPMRTTSYTEAFLACAEGGHSQKTMSETSASS